MPDCFLLPEGSTALDFAFFLHTDFGKNFIKAIDARSKKALGKDYKLKHRDALHAAEIQSPFAILIETPGVEFISLYPIDDVKRLKNLSSRIETHQSLNGAQP